MKSGIICFVLVAMSIFSFTSCKKDYTCTCTTSLGGISSTVVHDLPNQRINDATDACDRFESDANNTNGPTTTNCHL